MGGHGCPYKPGVVEKVRKTWAVIAGGSRKGATPSAWDTRAQGARLRHRNQVSGMAMITARAAESAARPTEAKSAPRQPPSVKISAYQSSDRPSGGNRRLCVQFSETQKTKRSGATRNSADNAIERRSRTDGAIQSPPARQEERQEGE